jgi:hypothetical protein
VNHLIAFTDAELLLAGYEEMKKAADDPQLPGVR